MRISRFYKPLMIAFAAAIALSANAQDSLPEDILVRSENLFPEGIEWDGERFLLSSLSEGTIYTISDEGEATAFIEDADLTASAGIEVDEANNRLLVTNLDRGAFNPFQQEVVAGLGSYDLTTGERLYMANLSGLIAGKAFPNDVAVDAEGNAYVTDSLLAALYKVDIDGNATVFLQDERFVGGFLSLNGIAYHPDGYLIVAQAGKGELYKVPVSDPDAMTQVALDEPVQGADGIIFLSDEVLIVVTGEMVYSLYSVDDWESAVIQVQFETTESATTAAIREESVYILYARMSALNFGGSESEFPIVRVEFEE